MLTAARRSLSSPDGRYRTLEPGDTFPTRQVWDQTVRWMWRKVDSKKSEQKYTPNFEPLCLPVDLMKSPGTGAVGKVRSRRFDWHRFGLQLSGRQDLAVDLPR